MHVFSSVIMISIFCQEISFINSEQYRLLQVLVSSNKRFYFVHINDGCSSKFSVEVCHFKIVFIIIMRGDQKLQ